MYAITRLQSPGGFRYWSVRFRRRGRGYYKSFYDVRRGGPKKALAAAVSWRDRQLKRAAVLTTREFRQLLRSSNSSGAPGVIFIRPKNQPQGSWQARLKFPGGHQIAKTFAVRKHGKHHAFALALAARADMLALVDDRPYLHHPTAKKFAARSAAKEKRL